MAKMRAVQVSRPKAPLEIVQRDIPEPAAVGGLGLGGKLAVVGIPLEPIEVSPLLLVFGLRSLAGSLAGTAVDAQDTLAFSQRSDVRPITEVFPLERAAEAYERMMSGKMRFRGVLTMAP